MQILLQVPYSWWEIFNIKGTNLNFTCIKYYWNFFSSFHNSDECVPVVDGRASSWWTFLHICYHSLSRRNNIIQTRLLANYEVGLDAVFISTSHFCMGVQNSEVLCVSESTCNKYEEYTMEERLLTSRQNFLIYFDKNWSQTIC